MATIRKRHNAIRKLKMLKEIGLTIADAEKMLDRFYDLDPRLTGEYARFETHYLFCGFIKSPANYTRRKAINYLVFTTTLDNEGHTTYMLYVKI